MENEDTSNVQPEVPPKEEEQTEECELEVKPSPTCEAGAAGEAVPGQTEDCEVDGRPGSEEAPQEASPEQKEDKEEEEDDTRPPQHVIEVTTTKLYVIRGQRLEVQVRNAVEALMDGLEPEDLGPDARDMEVTDSEDLLRLYTTLFAVVATVKVAGDQRPEEYLPQIRAVVDEVVDGFKRDGRYPENRLIEGACRAMLGGLRRKLCAREVMTIVNLLREEPALNSAFSRYLHPELRELENQSPRWWRTALKGVVFVTRLLLPIALWTLMSYSCSYQSK